MHTAALILLLLSAGRGSGVRSAPGGDSAPRWMASGLQRSATTANPFYSKRVRFNGAVTSLDWTQVTPGIDGLGGDTFTVAVLVDSVAVCSRTVGCDAAAGDYTVSCTDAAFTSGQDVDVRVTDTDCLTAPTGFPSLDGTSR